MWPAVVLVCGSFERGSFMQIAVESNFSYSVSVNGTAWLSGGHVGLHCAGKYLSNTDASLAATGPVEFSVHGADAELGNYEAAVQEYSSAQDGCQVKASIRYYAAIDSFEFVAEFPPEGLSNVSAAGPVRYDPHTKHSSWSSGPLPLATEFPSFDLPTDLGYLSSHGNSLGHNFAWSSNGGLENWADILGNGLQAGPLLLFRSNITQGDNMFHPPATMFAPLTHAKSVFVSTYHPPQGPSPVVSPVGLYGEVTHAKMNPIVCTQSGNVLTFVNQDSRADRFWVTANCSLVKPTGKKACTRGNFFSSNGSKFADENWTGDISDDGSSFSVSDGAVWKKEGSARNSSLFRLSAGVSGYVTELPPSFVQRVGLVGRPGINAAYRAWGDMVQALGHTERLTLNEDILNSKVTYWTDNGAYYCYCNRQNCNSCPDQHTPMGEILERLQKYHKEIGLEIDMYHFDSGFWHSQNPLGLCNGVTASNWIASPYHFPHGMNYYNTSFQLLFMLLAGPNFKTDLPGGNVYMKDWPMESSDEDVAGVGQISQVEAGHSHAFWEKIFGDRYADSSLRALVIDTLQQWFLGFSSRINNTWAQELWLDGYLGTASKYKMPVRIDQSLPSDHLASAEYSWAGVVAARIGGDMDSGDTWTQMASTGAFMASLNIRPIMDVLWTSPVQPGYPGNFERRSYIEHELVIAVLTTGPVGFGDMLNGTNVTRLSLASRADGVVLKPSYPALRLDSYYTGNTTAATFELWAAPAVLAAQVSAANDRRANSFVRLTPFKPSLTPHANASAAVTAAHGGVGVWWWTFFATDIPSSVQHTILPSQLWPAPTPESTFVVSVWGRTCINNSAASSCLQPFSAKSPLPVDTDNGSGGHDSSRHWRLYSAAPVFDNGFAIIGEQAKYVSVSPQRLLTSTFMERNPSDTDGLLPHREVFTSAGIAFRVIGKVGEVIDISVVVPQQTEAEPIRQAMAGTIRVIRVMVPLSGCAVVECSQDTCSWLPIPSYE